MLHTVYQKHTIHIKMAMLQCTCLATYSTLVSVGPACALPARPYCKFRGRELQSSTSFSIAGRRVCNTLPASVHDTNSSLRFRNSFLFVWRPRSRWRWTGALKWTHL